MTARGTIGERFNALTLIAADIGRSADGRILALWQCDCGGEVRIAYGRVRAGSTKSCGCLVVATNVARLTKHGCRGTPEYGSWIAMKRRCESPLDKDYPRYGGAGISVDPAWSASFELFLSHIGPRPAGTTLDRIDSRLGYKPGNVRWATAKVQGRNRRGTSIWHIRGHVFESIGEAAAHFAVSEQSIFRWVNGAFDRRRGTTTPPRADCFSVARYES